MIFILGEEMTAVAEPDMLQERRAAVRRRELILALEQWAPAYRDVAGDVLRYVAEIAEATEPERTWLREHVAAHGLPAGPARTADDFRAAGHRANAEASAAFLAGRYDQARDLIDEARAHGALFEAEWERLHAFITARAAAVRDA